MIKIHLSKIMGEKRVNQRQIAMVTGLRPNTINELYHERAKRIDFSTVELLCKALECQPGDLFEYVPGDKE